MKLKQQFVQVEFHRLVITEDLQPVLFLDYQVSVVDSA